MAKWYIDHIKEKDSFFKHLEEISYCANNMYSSGPFTEAAVREMWASQSTITGRNYLSEAYFDNNTIFQVFKDNGYFIYMGELIPFFNDNFIVDNNNVQREEGRIRGFIHLWKNRLLYFIDIYKKGEIKDTDFSQLEFILDCFFNTFSSTDKILLEKEKFKNNIKKYIEDILQNVYQSSFFKYISSKDYFNSMYRNAVNVNKIIENPLLPSEEHFLFKAKYKNTQYLLESINDADENKVDVVEKLLSGSSNRCIHSNNDLISHMRMNFEKLPKLKDELDTFIKWYDEDYDVSQPFFAYIHNYDFHYQESFINSEYEDMEAYTREIREKAIEIDELEFKKMSLSKQLTMRNIENNLAKFWEELAQRNIFDNTYVILTADHGISNYMYPANRNESERWNYLKTNFQVPFYMQGCNITPEKDNSFYMARCILPTLIEKCALKNTDNIIGKSINEEKNNEFSYAIWINGIPDFYRQQMKVGIRNQKYSMTFEAFVTQIFDTSEIKGVYDLTTDPDECNNLKWKKIQDEEFIKLYNTLKDIWFNNIQQILLDKNVFQNRFEFLINNEEFYKNYNKKTQRVSWYNFECMANHRKLILFGSGDVCRQFISNKSFKLDVKEIWDNDIKKDGTYFMGHKIVNPPLSINHDNIFVIITSRYELEIIEQLRQMGVTEFMPCKLIGDY